MAEWADYVITHVRYNEHGDRITAVKRRKDAGTTLIEPEEKDRWEVIMGLTVGLEYCTAYKNSDGDYVRGEDIHKVNISDTTYLRTDGNEIEQDNLGELPQF